jgi:hypothetical protein
MKNYQKVITEMGQTFIKATDENNQEFWIPTDPGNSDYAEYLASLENEGIQNG